MAEHLEAAEFELAGLAREEIVVGLISDTHGLLRPEAVEALRGCQNIVHAGDIGGAEILEELGRIAPVTAVRGNNDHGSWSSSVPLVADLTVAGVHIHALHDIADLRPSPTAGDVRVVVTGHSHKPREEHRGGVLYVNPGSAGPRRFSLPVSLARLHIKTDASLRIEFVTLL